MLDGNVDFKFVFKEQRGDVIERTGDTRPAEVVFGAVHRKT